MQRFSREAGASSVRAPTSQASVHIWISGSDLAEQSHAGGFDLKN